MSNKIIVQKSKSYLDILCSSISERCVGSDGNRLATDFFEKELALMGWDTEKDEFEAFDWNDGGAKLVTDNGIFNPLVSPYSLPFSGEGELVAASTVEALEESGTKDKIILLHGEIATEQLMPKNFIFYNPENHKRIIAALENSGAKAIISATGRNASLAGGVYPFPLIEDGDFNIPSVYMTEEEGAELLASIGTNIKLESKSSRIPGKGCNVIGRKNNNNVSRIVITAHIDAKKGTPGAIDNATGVIVLLLLANMLKDYSGNKLIEIVALNGEDYYAVSGQMNYVKANSDSFNNMLLNINIDGAGYHEGPSAFSFFNLPEMILNKAKNIVDQYEGITEGVPWPQGDHSIFVQFGVPAIAVSSQWFIDNIDIQDITHTSKDNPDIVKPEKIVEIADALNKFILSL